MKDLLAVPLFKVGDIIASFTENGKMLARPTLITKIINRNGWTHYEGLRQDPEDIKINGPKISYSHLSVVRFKVIGFNPAAATLFT